MPDPKDIQLLYAALKVADASRIKGNLPFGCLLADEEGNILLEAGNTVITDQDAIAHCEINLVHRLAGKYERNFLARCTIYASTEPCPMCTAAVFWSAVGRLVFALSKQVYHSIAKTSDPAYFFDMPSKELLRFGGRKVEVIGPLLEEEAKILYRKWI